MKNIFKIITLFAVTCLVTMSCDYDESNFKMLTNDVDPNATYYLQFKDASKNLQTGVNESGDLVDIDEPIVVALLGAPQTEDTVVNISIDPSTTIDASMYELSATSIVIPAGETSASINVRTNTELMPIGEALNLVINIDAGENNATAGTQINYELFRIKFCLLELTDYVGTWSGTDSWDYNTEVTTFIDSDGDLAMNGIGFGWFQDWWGEVIIANTAVKVDINLITGEIVIDPSKQTAPYLTSTYNGALQPDYNIQGTGKILSTCDRIIELNYSFIQGGGSFDGTSWGPAFKESIQVD